MHRLHPLVEFHIGEEALVSADQSAATERLREAHGASTHAPEREASMDASTPPPTAAALIIGDEILSGRTQDVNLNAIARFVAAHGIDLAEARVVGDVSGEIVASLNALRARYGYVFTTGGIGPTHDDITADCVAEAFGLPLHEHPEIIAGMEAQNRARLAAGDEPYAITPARRRMARVPEGASLIRNPVRGPPGFQIGNVFVLAGVPAIMRGMLEDVGWRLQGGAVVVSRTLQVDGTGEGVIAAPLEQVARAHPSLSLGSYPFFEPDRFGASLVVRGRDAAEVSATVDELAAALRAQGIEGLTDLGA
jgi:molybdopterin-biosynthesis enzyme MoeA-like protein